MRISGLSNQWKTRERLFDEFAAFPSEELPEGIPCKYSKIRELFHSLERIEGPDLYIGTSHGMMNFSNRESFLKPCYMPTFRLGVLNVKKADNKALHRSRGPRGF